MNRAHTRRCLVAFTIVVFTTCGGLLIQHLIESGRW